MKRWSSMLLAVLVLALMGLARLPVPCKGDGHGHPCSMTTCACDATCTCKAACDEMQRHAESQAAAHSGPHAHCHMKNMAGHTACTMTMPKDAPRAPSHFAPPAPQPPVLIGLGFRPRRLAARWTPRDRVAPALFASRFLTPPEPPPRITG